MTEKAGVPLDVRDVADTRWILVLFFRYLLKPFGLERIERG
jgi:hypothetical protein